ncbi:MAG: RHS repeat domain-containing protein, partial [Bacteriovoracia bacterium]
MKMDDVLGVEVSEAGANAGLASSPGKFYFLKDALGTITDVTDASGTIVQRYSYSAFGKLLKTMSADGTELDQPVIKTHYAFTGRELDQESGLYYYRARYYDASIGRFLQEDPESGRLAKPSTAVNRYSYVSNNPFKYIDSSGREEIETPWMMFAYLGASVIFGKVPLIDHGNWCGWKVAPGEKGLDPRPIDGQDAACRKHDLDLITIANRESIF